MVVYTFATIAFYLLGAAVLSRIDLVPAGNELISTLSAMYEPVFDHWFEIVFLFGSIAVLYSTFFVANAGHARVCADALRVMGLAAPSEAARRRRVRIFSGLFPVWCLVLYLVFPEPVKLVLASGVMQAIMLPMLAAAALYFRYYRCDRRVAPTRHWDAWLWLSGVAMLLTALCVIITQVLKYVGSSS